MATRSRRLKLEQELQNSADHTSRINNWDLVDASVPYIVGAHLLNSSGKLLDKLAASDNVWERRISLVTTLFFIKQRQLDDAFRIAEKLLSDKHDLIHKAVGWALRKPAKFRLERCWNSSAFTPTNCREHLCATQSSASRPNNEKQLLLSGTKGRGRQSLVVE